MPHKCTIHKNQKGEWFARIRVDAAGNILTSETLPLRGRTRGEIIRAAQLEYENALYSIGKKIQTEKAFTDGEDITALVSPDPPAWSKDHE